MRIIEKLARHFNIPEVINEISDIWLTRNLLLLPFHLSINW